MQNLFIFLSTIYIQTLFLVDSQETCGTNSSPKSCVPPWTVIGDNISKISVTSNCGQHSPEELCSQDGTCEVCTTDSHPAINLINQLNDKTCWVSGRVKQTLTGNMDDSVNITLPFGKRFEILYISLQSCMENLEDFPDSIAIFKSTDFQRTWKPWRYFSKNCQHSFRMPTTDDYSSFNSFGVYCSSIRPTLYMDTSRVTRDSTGRLFGGNNNQARAITFSTKTGRQVNSEWSPILNDWISATDIRISLWKHPKDSIIRRSITFTKNANESRIDSGEFIALSSIKIAGRCQCNGHASECSLTQKHPNGPVKLVCKCQHNTEGQDCEHCMDSHMDIPWSRSVPDKPAICKMCNCNLHSETCRFSNTKYLTTNRTQGGVCANCRDNTQGDQCDECISGYYRDWSKPVSHKDVCLPCNCSLNGSLSRICNATSGQCFCKEGVSGLYCNRCAEGYSFTNNPQQPCISIVDTIPIQKAQHNLPCSTCFSTRERISLARFCKKDLFFVGFINDVKFIDDMVRLDVTASVLWKIDIIKQGEPGSAYFPSWAYTSNFNETSQLSSIVFNPYSLEEVMIKPVKLPIWLTLKDYRCSCPSTQLGQAYLFGLNFQGHYNPEVNRNELMIHQASVVIPWREAWTQRLNNLRYRANQGACSQQSRMGRGHRKRHLLRRAKNARLNSFNANINPGYAQNNYQRWRRNPRRFLYPPS